MTKKYFEVRQYTEEICRPLAIEDYVIQSADYVSPPKWHLAHTTWFFECFLLKPYLPKYQEFDDKYSHLFNSYYKSVGSHWKQSQRGCLARPTVEEILQYRYHVDAAVQVLLESPSYCSDKVLSIVEVGLHHEQQHQELLLMDILHNLSCHPFSVNSGISIKKLEAPKINQQVVIPEGLYSVGAVGSGFAYDNEYPRHKVHLRAAALDVHFVTNGDYLKFIEFGGYENHSFWLSEGWAWVEQQTSSEKGFKCPLYWSQKKGEWFEFSLTGEQPLNLEAPVAHLNFYEAFAYCQFVGARMPTEQEWEVAAQLNPKYESQKVLWQWTQSSYLPYPGYEKQEGALGEYNGKFMSSQMVLRGSSWATPESHERTTYRNFYYPSQRWMFSGLRLARDLK